MKVSRINIQNFKSFNEKTEIELVEGLNTIVGENNAGKSNIFRALNAIKEQSHFNKDDFHNGNTDSPGVISIDVLLEEEDLNKFFNFLEMSPALAEEFKDTFKIDTSLKMRILSNEPGRLSHNTEIGVLSFAGSVGNFEIISPAAPYNRIRWNDIKKQLEIGENLKAVLKRAVDPKVNSSIDFHRDVSSFFQDLITYKNMVIFPEFRERPDKNAVDTFDSPDGKNISSVLFNLKNGNRKQRKIFETIKEDFSNLFLNLKLDVMKRGGNIEIVIEKIKAKHEVPLDFVGGGIAEIIIMLTHIVTAKNKVFFIDEPELHLHPHTQRLLLGILKEASKENRIIMVTHSSHFIDFESVDGICVIREVNGESHVFRPEKGYFSDIEKQKLKGTMRTEDREFFFSRAVLLVEGETEIGAMPIFAKKLNIDFDVNAISVIRSGGNHFSSFIKLLEGYSVPYIIMCDKDVSMQITCSIKKDKVHFKTSTIFHQLSELGLLKKQDFNEIKKMGSSIVKKGSLENYREVNFEEIKRILSKYNIYVLSSDFEGVIKSSGNGKLLTQAHKEYGKSKVHQGIYVAENLDKVPDEFSKIIKKVASKN